MKVRERNRYNQVLHMTQDTTWESDKNTIKHHKQDPRGQSFPSRCPHGTNEQTQKQDINNTTDSREKYRLQTVIKYILLEGLTQFHGANYSCNIYPCHNF